MFGSPDDAAVFSLALKRLDSRRRAIPPPQCWMCAALRLRVSAPILAAADRFSGSPRPEPLCLPPPSCLSTVAQARRSASLSEKKLIERLAGLG